MLHLQSRRFQNYRTLPTVPSRELNALWNQEIALHTGVALMMMVSLAWVYLTYIGLV